MAELTEEQKNALVFMYQEEKLARDVYTTLSDKWKRKIFVNIKKSEQKHMDSVKILLERYNIPIPVIEDEIGIFEDEELKPLYGELTEQGLKSEVDALKAGITLEEKDIADLEEKLVNAPSDITIVFNNLLKGSQNHLKAFTRVLERVEQTTTTQTEQTDQATETATTETEKTDQTTETATTETEKTDQATETATTETEQTDQATETATTETEKN